MGGERPEWLPVGWKIRVKARSCGKKDKYYVNPSNGLKLSSKPQVLRYLKSSGKDRKPKELDKIDLKNTVAKQLPPGWIKEIRTRKKGTKIRRDAYYIDPVSGRNFRSMQEVYRYIKSMDSGESTSKPDDKGHVTLELGDHSKPVRRLVSSGEAKGQRSIGKKADKHPTQNQRVKSGVTHANGLKGASVKNVNMLEDNHLEKREDSLASEISDKHKIVVIKKLADHRVDKKSANSDQRSKSGDKVVGLTKVDMQREKEDNFVAGNLPNKSPRVDVKEQVNGGRRRSMRLAGSKQNKTVTEVQSSRLGSEGSAGKNIYLPESNDLNRREKENKLTGGRQQHKNLARQKKRKPPNRKCTNDLPGRPSKRQAQLEIEHPYLEIKTSNKSGVSATLSDDSEVTTTKNAIEDGPVDEPLNDDTNGKISNDSNENSANSLEQHKSLAHRKKRKNPISKCSDLNGRASKRHAQLEIKHPSMEIKTINKSEVSATLSEGSEVITTNKLVKAGLSGKPLIDDTNGKISNDSNLNPTKNQEEHKPIVLYRRRKKSNSKCTSELPGRTSKRLAQVEIEHPSLEIKTNSKSGVSATLSDESEVTTTKNIVKDRPSDEPLMDDTNGNISNGSNENPVNHQEKTTHDCKGDEKVSRKLDSPLEDLLMDPCIEFAFKTLTGAIPIEEVNKVGDSPVSSLPLPNQTLTPKLPSGHIWADPCFEFAVKMLTGEMPTTDNALFHASFQQPLGSSLDNLNSSSYPVNQIDVLKKPSLSQEGVKDPSYPHAASGSSHNSFGTSRG